MENPRVVTWRAVSTEDQVERISLQHQADLNRQHVAQIGGIVVADLHVDGESRNIDLWEDAIVTLDAFHQLDALLRKRPVEFDILMCYDLSRVCRTDSLTIDLAKRCERAGVRIYECMSPPSTLDGPISTPDSRLVLMFRAHQNDQEVRKFAERSFFGRRARAQKGKHAGNPPFGYKRMYDENGISFTIVDEEQAPVVRLFYDLFLNHGRSLNAICQEFAARGFVSPQSKNPWVPGTLQRMLRNAWAYAGYVTWGHISKKVKPEDVFRARAEWEPLITEEMARTAEALIVMRRQVPRSVSGYHRYSLIARCGYCGHNVIVKNRAGRSGCISNRYGCRQGCHGSATGDPEMREALHNLIEQLADQDFFESLIDETPDYFAALEQNKVDAEKVLEQVKAERKRLTLAFTRESITIGEYDELMAELQQRMNVIAKTVSDLSDTIANTPTADSRRSRLEEIRDHGLEMLYHPDNRTANAWLRARFVLIIQDYQVYSYKIL